MNNDDPDADIPVLTEIIVRQEPAEAASSQTPLAPPSLAVETDAAPQVPGNADSAVVAAITATDMPPLAASADQWQALERKINERVLYQLQNRIDSVLEHRVRDSLADALQLAVDGIAANIRHGLHLTLEDVIARAVAQEIAHLQMSCENPPQTPAVIPGEL